MSNNLVRYEQNTIYEQGYGIIAKKVMRDRNLPTTAKAIYAYICSFAGAGETAFPSISLMAYELNISKDTLYKHIKKLKEAGYIEVKQNRTKENRFANNIYIIKSTPCPAFPCPKNSETKEYDTIINNVNSNSFNNNRSEYSALANASAGYTEFKRICYTGSVSGVEEAIQYFFRRYEEIFSKPHHALRNEQIEEVKEILNSYGIFEDMSLAVDIIEQYFTENADKPNCNCSILHFVSGRIIPNLLAREITTSHVNER